LKLIQEGYQIQFAKTPKPWYSPKRFIPAEEQKEVNIAIDKLLNAGIIESVQIQEQEVTSPGFSPFRKPPREDQFWTVAGSTNLFRSNTSKWKVCQPYET
jgi:hypothetical protein